jgi:hypothetical protein
LVVRGTPQSGVRKHEDIAGARVPKHLRDEPILLNVYTGGRIQNLRRDIL